MANNLEIPDDSNIMKTKMSLTRTRSPFLSSIVHGSIPLNPGSKQDANLLSPLKQDTRSAIARERQTLRSKSQVSFTLATETTPVNAPESPFLKRQKTFESFLKSRDIELMIGDKSRHNQNSSTIERHSPMDQPKPVQPVNLIQAIPSIDVKHTLKKKEGKMFTNELWSAGYYMDVLHRSNLKKKPQHTISMILKPLHQKFNEMEVSSNNAIQSPSKNNSYTLNISPCYDFTNQSIRDKSQPREAESLQLSSEASPVSNYKGQSVLRSILRNITPRKEALERNASSPNSLVYQKDILIPTESSPVHMFSELSRNPKAQRMDQKLRTTSIHTSFEKRCEEERMNTTWDMSPVNLSKARKIPPGKYLTRIAAKANGSKTPCGSKTSLKNTGRGRNEISDFLDASSTIRHDSMHHPSKSMQMSTENIESIQKVQLLINQCIDLGQENKNLEKEVISTQAGLEAYTKRRKILKLQLRKRVEMSEDLQRKTQAIRVQRQRQGVS